MSACNSDWFAVYTKPRQEQSALLNLERQSFKCYLPMADSLDQHSNARGKARHEPLFPRYLFLYADPEVQSLGPVRSTRGVTGLVRAGVELIKIPESIIAGLKVRMHPATGLIPIDSVALNHGDKVRVCDGPFADLQGVFREHQGLRRSLLLLEVLGRKATVNIASTLLQRVN
ncbi:MAG: transcriptional antiterminator RfaH [Oceanicoccus sp.]|jgi:transcriptional antiterminator RfaH